MYPVFNYMHEQECIGKKVRFKQISETKEGLVGSCLVIKKIYKYFQDNHIAALGVVCKRVLGGFVIQSKNDYFFCPSEDFGEGIIMKEGSKVSGVYVPFFIKDINGTHSTKEIVVDQNSARRELEREFKEESEMHLEGVEVDVTRVTMTTTYLSYKGLPVVLPNTLFSDDFTPSFLVLKEGDKMMVRFRHLSDSGCTIFVDPVVPYHTEVVNDISDFDIGDEREGILTSVADKSAYVRIAPGIDVIVAKSQYLKGLLGQKVMVRLDSVGTKKCNESERGIALRGTILGRAGDNKKKSSDAALLIAQLIMECRYVTQDQIERYFEGLISKESVRTAMRMLYEAGFIGKSDSPFEGTDSVLYFPEDTIEKLCPKMPKINISTWSSLFLAVPESRLFKKLMVNEMMIEVHQRNVYVPTTKETDFVFIEGHSKLLLPLMYEFEGSSTSKVVTTPVCTTDFRLGGVNGLIAYLSQLFAFCAVDRKIEITATFRSKIFQNILLCENDSVKTEVKKTVEWISSKKNNFERDDTEEYISYRSTFFKTTHVLTMKDLKDSYFEKSESYDEDQMCWVKSQIPYVVEKEKANVR